MNKIIVIMGVSGCGKTTIAQQLSKKLSIPYFDADDFHPKRNVDKMANGKPLNDADRFPWLTILNDQLKKCKEEKGAILACSALKEVYREILSKNVDIYWVYLEGNFELIKKRLEERNNHFMSSLLLKSQFETLEVPEYGVHENIDATPEQIVENIIRKIKE